MKKRGCDYNLVVSIDRASGVSIDDCKVVSDAVEPLLDEADPIEGPYASRCPARASAACCGPTRICNTPQSAGCR